MPIFAAVLLNCKPCCLSILQDEMENQKLLTEVRKEFMKNGFKLVCLLFGPIKLAEVDANN